MISKRSPIFGAVVLFSNISCLSAIYAVFFIIEHNTFTSPCLGIWMCFAVTCYISARLLLRRERSTRFIIVLHASFLAAQTAVCFIVYGLFAPVTAMLIAAVMWIVGYFRSYSILATPVTTDDMMSTFEINTAMLIFSVFFSSTKGTPLSAFIPVIASTVISLASLVALRTAGHRTDSNSGALRGSAAIISAASIIAIAVIVFVISATDLIGRAVSAIWLVMLSFFRWAAEIINRFIMWLASFIPDAEIGEYPPQEGIPTGPGAMEEQLLIDPDVIMYIFLGIIGLGVAAFVIYMIVKGGNSITLGRIGGSKGVRRSRIKLFALIAAVFKKLTAKLKYTANRITKSNTAPGLFAALEYRYAVKHQGRAPSETCRSFLLRILPDHPGAEDAIMSLADALDMHYFGSGDNLKRHDVITLRREIRRAASKQNT